MRAGVTHLALCIGVYILAGCASATSSWHRADSAEVIEEARRRVLGQSATLDSDSREMIRTNAPKILYVGAPFGGQYTYQWAITSNRFVELVTYTAEDLKERPVFVRESVPDHH